MNRKALAAILATALILALLAACGGGEESAEQHDEATHESEAAMTTAEMVAAPAGMVGDTVIDPICDMEVVVTDSSLAVAYDNEHYFFCSAHCQKEFAAHPEQYLAGEAHEHSEDDDGESDGH